MFAVWFECKTCRGSFLELSHFLEHKKEDHFDEFQNTECIIFEERRIPNYETLTISFSPMPQEIGDSNPHEFIDPETIKIDSENFEDCTSSEFQFHTEDQTLNFFETDYTVSSDQDLENETDDFISSKNGASATHSVDNSSISENSSATNVAYLDKDSCEYTKNILDLENTADAAVIVNADAFNSSDLEPTQLFIETQRNSFVLLKRLTRQEIQRWSGMMPKRTRSVKYTKKTDSFVHSLGKCSDKKLNNFFECKLCPDKFNTDLELTAHTSSCIQSNSNRTPFYCSPCNRIFSSSDSLKKHVITNHPEGQKTVKSEKLKKCHWCSRKFLYEYDLKRHTLTHSRNKQMQKPSSRPIKSRRCGASILKKYKLSQHSMRLKKTEKRSNEQRINNISKTKNKNNDQLPLTISVGSGSQKFNCDQPGCKKSFLSKPQRERHMATHSTARPFKCPEPNCEKTFKRKDHVRLHTIGVHSDSGPGKRSQVNCKKRITENRSFSKLALTHSNRGPIKCPISSCPQTFKHKYSIPVHMLHHTDIRQFKCTQIDCGKTFQLRHHLTRHLSTHSDAKPFKCRKASCQKTFKTSDGLRNHMKIHSKLMLNKCPEVDCQKRFNSKRSLREHLLTYQYNKPNKCSGIEAENSTSFLCNKVHCGKQFRDKFCLKRHFDTVHLDKRPFKCPVSTCGYTFKQKNHLKVHLLTKKHTDTHPRCRKTVPSKHQLERHIGPHSTARPFKCSNPNCEKTFKKEDHVRLHTINVHSDSEPGKGSQVNCKKSMPENSSVSKLAPTNSKRGLFKCPISSCPKKFTHKNSIPHHMVLHSDLRPFKCTQLDCGKTFQLKNHLTRHLSTHSEAKPFKCRKASCQKTFKTSDGLRSHMNVHSDLQLKKCPEVGCKKMFKSKPGLREHLLLHHHLKLLKFSGNGTSEETNANLQGTQSAIKIDPASFRCEHPNCGKQFSLRCRLKRHKATHSETRPFTCPEPSCLKAYKGKKYLLRHVRIHGNSKLDRKNDSKSHTKITEDASSKSTRRRTDCH